MSLTAHRRPTRDPDSIWEEQAKAAAPEPTLSAATEVALLCVFGKPLPPEVMRHDAFARLEAEICAAVAALSAVESYALARRLRANRTDDALVRSLDRLTPERRARIVFWTSDPKVRAARAARQAARR